MAVSPLLKKTQKLYDEVFELVLERDRLIYFTTNELDTKYRNAMEGRVYELEELQLKALKLQRIASLIEEGCSPEEAEQAALEELSQDVMLHEMGRDQRIKRDGLSEDEAEELDEIYGELIKILHPDLNPLQKLELATLYIYASSAYEACSLEMLKDTLSKALEFEVLELSSLDDEGLRERQKALKAAKTQLREAIDNITDEYPFDKEDILEDEELLEDEKNRYDEAIKTVREFIEQA